MWGPDADQMSNHSSSSGSRVSAHSALGSQSDVVHDERMRAREPVLLAQPGPGKAAPPTPLDGMSLRSGTHLERRQMPPPDVPMLSSCAHAASAATTTHGHKRSKSAASTRRPLDQHIQTRTPRSSIAMPGHHGGQWAQQAQSPGSARQDYMMGHEPTRSTWRG